MKALLPATLLGLAAVAPLEAQISPSRRLFLFEGDAAMHEFGSAVDFKGDSDGDGYLDPLVGAPMESLGLGNNGAIYLYSGRSGQLIRTVTGDSPGDQFGCSVAYIGDIDGDGCDDYVVGADGDDDGGSEAGSARLFSGLTGRVIRTLHGTGVGQRFGRSVSAAGDVNRDGTPDMIVGAPGDTRNGLHSGSAIVFSGRNAGVIWRFFGQSPGEFFGHAVCGAGKIDADLHDDVAVGAYLADDAGANAGNVKIFSGSSGQTLRRIDGDAAGDQFGISVARVGDYDGDKFDDLIVGAWMGALNGPESGYAKVVSGATGLTLRAVAGVQAGDHLGWSVAGAGDYDGDGLLDFMAGAPTGDPSNMVDAGYVRLFRGGGVHSFLTFQGDSAGDQLGFAIAGGADINFDRRDDVFLGAPLDDDTGSNAGTARLQQNPNLFLLRPDPGASGTRNDFTLVDGPPFTIVTYFYGFQMGEALLARCPATPLAIKPPIYTAGEVRTDGSGAATLSLPVPRKAANRRILLQVGALPVCRISNLVDVVFS